MTIGAKQWPPKCRDCGKTTRRVVSNGSGGHLWLCESCELLRAKPDAPRAVKMPHERRARPLQSEKLFEA